MNCCRIWKRLRSRRQPRRSRRCTRRPLRSLPVLPLSGRRSITSSSDRAEGCRRYRPPLRSPQRRSPRPGDAISSAGRAHRRRAVRRDDRAFDLVPDPPGTPRGPRRSAVAHLRHGGTRRRPMGKIVVARAQDVAQGAPLIRIDNPELLAKQRQSDANLGVAEAELARAKAGFRPEIIAERKAGIDRAEAELTLAQKTFNRPRKLVGSARLAASATRPRQRGADDRGTHARSGSAVLSGGGGRLHP